jgi:UDP-N-acetyl-D-mannosaminuronic acid dehydrogenase
MASKIRKLVSKIKNPKLLLCGTTFKPNTNDLRESPALEIARLLEEDGYDLVTFDNLMDEYTEDSFFQLFIEADCVCVLVEHDEMVELLKKAICRCHELDGTIPILFQYSETNF